MKIKLVFAFETIFVKCHKILSLKANCPHVFCKKTALKILKKKQLKTKPMVKSFCSAIAKSRPTTSLNYVYAADVFQ